MFLKDVNVLNLSVNTKLIKESSTYKHDKLQKKITLEIKENSSLSLKEKKSSRYVPQIKKIVPR